jgi:hypothetical protein
MCIVFLNTNIQENQITLIQHSDPLSTVIAFHSKFSPVLITKYLAVVYKVNAIEKFTNWAGKGTAFVEWTSPNDLVDWPEATERLKKPPLLL